MKKALPFLILAVIIAISAIFITRNKSFTFFPEKYISDREVVDSIFEEHEEDIDSLVQGLTNRRKDFEKRYARIEDLLTAIENEDAVFKISNISSFGKSFRIPFAWNEASFRKKINIKKTDSAAQRYEKIHNFIASNYTSGTTPYREGTREFQSPTTFFNFFAFGNCGIVSNMFASIAKYYNLNSRILMLNGHIVNAAAHDGKIRVYDNERQGIGFLKGKDGLAIPYDELVKLAREEKLGDETANKLFGSSKEHRFSNIVKKAKFSDLKLLLYPNARIFFFDDLYVLTVGTSRLYYDNQRKRYLSKEEFLNNYKNSINNFALITPLKEKYLKNNQFIHASNYPVLGAFIRVKNDQETLITKPPKIEAQFYIATVNEADNARERVSKTHSLEDGSFPMGLVETELLEAKSDEDTYSYYDLTAGVSNVEPMMNYKFKVTDLDELFKRYGDSVELITIHPYAKHLLDWEI